MVSLVGRGMGVLDGGGDRRREGTILGVNLGHPIVTDGTLRHSYSVVRGGDAALPKLGKGRYVRRCSVRAMYLSASAVAGKP